MSDGHFFCIEIRHCTIILTIISLLISTFFACAFLVKPDVVSSGLPLGLSLSLGIFFIFVALVSIFGIIASLLHSAGGVRVLTVTLWIVEAIYILVVILVIVVMIRTKQEAIEICIKQVVKSQNITEPNTNIKESCKDRESKKIWMKSSILILPALFFAFFSWVASRFSYQSKITYFKRRTLIESELQSRM